MHLVAPEGIIRTIVELRKAIYLLLFSLLYEFQAFNITSGHDVDEIRVQFSNMISVPFRLDVACICGQNPLVFYILIKIIVFSQS